MIRIATLVDVQRVTALARDFHAYSPWREVPFDDQAMAVFIAGLIEHGVVFLSDDGFLAGLLSPLYFSPTHVVAAEMMWWAPKGGTELREAFEAWGSEHGAFAVQFSGLGDGRSKAIARLFRSAGYHPIETGFLKRL